jgi:hypothetical protein
VSLERRSQAEEIAATVDTMRGQATDAEREFLERAFDLIAPYFVGGSDRAFTSDQGDATASPRPVDEGVQA